MESKGFKRKLSAILSADVVGYSRLMGENEEITIRSVNTYRKLITSLTEKHHGRVVDSPGDNLLAEFTSVIDAVRCAVEVQEEIADRNAEIPGSQKMEYRIGINIGDVVDEEGRIYGDGVNIAARLESLFCQFPCVSFFLLGCSCDPNTRKCHVLRPSGTPHELSAPLF